MAVYVIDDAVVSINSVDLSDHITHVEVSASKADETYQTVDSPARKRVGGVEDWMARLAFVNDFAAAKVYATLQPLFGTSTTLTITPTSASASATNPECTATVRVNDWKFMAGDAGKLDQWDVSWPIDGEPAFATS